MAEKSHDSPPYR